MMHSLAAGGVVETASVDTIADGMAIRSPIAASLELLKPCIDAVVAVDDAAILEAARLLLRTTGILAEPSGAGGIAAIMTHRDTFAGRRIAAVVTGSNLSLDFQRRLLAA
jgi:threonine dehydratase